MKALLTALCALLPAALCAQNRVQTDNAHLWVTFFNDTRLSQHWSVHAEGHWRRHDLGQTWQQLLLRPAVNYHTANALITVGYSYYQNFGYGDFPIRFGNAEHHLWEQVTFSHPLGQRLRLHHRYRLEQRYIEVYNPDPATGEARFSHHRYLNRFRYRVLATYPLGKPQLGPSTWFASAYEEAFLTFGDPANFDGFQQNRLSALLGYQFDANGSSVQLGYLWQVIFRPNAGPAAVDLLESNSTLHLVLTWNLDLRRKK